MARKPGDAPVPHNGLNDVIGIALFVLALLLVVSQLSFDRYDLASVRVPPNKETHNWIGIFGAYFAWSTFLPLGVAAYLLPWLFMVFGVGYVSQTFAFLRERVRMSILWSVILLLSLTGLLHILDINSLAGFARERMHTNSAGGFVGWFSYRYGRSEERRVGKECW